jgi:hypothetical protein
VISRGEIVEQGTHSDLVASGGVYKGLVEAQRITTDITDVTDGKIEEVEEAINEVVKVKSADSADIPLGLSRTKTGRSAASIEMEKGKEFTEAGVVEETQYSNYQLIRRVCHFPRFRFYLSLLGRC